MELFDVRHFLGLFADLDAVSDQELEMTVLLSSRTAFKYKWVRRK